MLILSRKPGDAIIIEGGIRVVVLACDRKSVRLGIEAPASVSILRSEIVAAIAEENQRATDTAEATQWLSGLSAQKPEPPDPAAE
ncbi:MAG: carbon storage regulator CsrA [bacterium]